MLPDADAAIVPALYPPRDRTSNAAWPVAADVPVCPGGRRYSRPQAG